MAAGTPPRAGLLRTPESRFAEIPGYPWPPSSFEVEPGLRTAYVDNGPRNAREAIVLLVGEPAFGDLCRKRIAPRENAGFRVVVSDRIGALVEKFPQPPSRGRAAGGIGGLSE